MQPIVIAVAITGSAPPALVPCLRSSSPFATNFGDEQATEKTQLVRRFHRTALVRFLGIAALARAALTP